MLIGSTGYDGFSNSWIWLQWSQNSALSGVPAGTLGLLAFSAAVYLTYVGACWAAGTIGDVPARGLPDLFVAGVMGVLGLTAARSVIVQARAEMTGPVRAQPTPIVELKRRQRTGPALQARPR